ncbi:MAG: CHAT domain-containing protein [Deltaproteobacteria bacterium]|nr:CHAT domain-containing protein [Deltaproteobacteria bacterium]
MKTNNYFLPICSILLLLTLCADTAYGESLEGLVQKGDRYFNQGDYQMSLGFYQQAYVQLAGETLHYPLSTEIINNIAAVNMAQGNLQAFYKNFTIARDIKQQLARKSLTRHADGNLLINGGFEEGLVFPWGTGCYELKFHLEAWWNSGNAKAFMKIDTAEKHSGNCSLLVTNYSHVQPHVFTTLSQRISGVQPNTVYKISFYAKAKGLSGGAVSFAVDAAWDKRFCILHPGTYDWRAFSETINIGHNDYIDFRILHTNTGTVWLDDIVIEKVQSSEYQDLQHAQSLFDSAKYEEALKIYMELEEKYRENKAKLRQIKQHSGRVFLVRGKYNKALERFTWAINNGLTRANIDLAELYYMLGDYDTAERYFNKSLKIVKGDQGAESLVYNKLSRCCLAQEDRLDEALDYQQYSFYILKHIGDEHGQALSLNQLGLISRQKQKYRLALTHFDNALTLARRLDDKKLTSDILFNIANMAYDNKELDKAQQYVDEALSIKKEINDQLGLVRTLHIQAHLYKAGDQLEKARESYCEAVSFFEELSFDAGHISRETKATFMKQFMELYRDYVELLLILAHYTGKEDYYHQEAFQVAEKARSRVFTEMILEAHAMQSFAATSNDRDFGQFIEKEIKLNRQIHKLAKQFQKAGKESSEDLRKRLELAKQKRNALQNTMELRYPRYADLKKPKPLLIKDVQKLLAPDEAALSYFVTPSRTALWAITREDVNFVIIPLSSDKITDQSDKFCKVFSDITNFIANKHRPDKKSVENCFKRAFALYNADNAHGLYKTLVFPVENILQSKRVVYLVLDDHLYKLPFEALLTKPFKEEHINSKVIGATLKTAPFWVKTHDIAYLPSLSVLRSLRTLEKDIDIVSGQKPLLAFANPMFKSPEGTGSSENSPDNATIRFALLRKLRIRACSDGKPLDPLPETEKEAIHVAKILGASIENDVYLQDRASEHNLKSLPLRSYKNFLFATHSCFVPGMQPALALSCVNDPENDGLLEMGEILGLDLNAELIVLSACNTASGSGKEDRGEGFAGLTRSFMYAGARSLLVTQWGVESSSAKNLVQSIFTKSEDYNISQALAGSKREMIASRGRVSFRIGFFKNLNVSLAHPYFWAPYVLVGEAR